MATRREKANFNPARLRYVTDAMPGIRRLRAGEGFRYVGVNGQALAKKELQRIAALSIPPAWTDVWICPDAAGHIQARGRDARGRKQYRYHSRWREIRDANKFDRLLIFVRALPHLRARVERDLARPDISRAKVLATVVKLLDTTMIRIGNEEYARHNGSIGLTTMRNRHVHVAGKQVHFHFMGKSRIRHDVTISNGRLACIVRRLQDLPGQELFQYIAADGERHGIDSKDVNDYLRQVTGQDITAKDFRTWTGTVIAASSLLQRPSCASLAQAKRHMIRAIADVARQLGNTPAICRKCYIHPGVVDAYLDGKLAGAFPLPSKRERFLRAEESALRSFLSKRKTGNNGTG